MIRNLREGLASRNPAFPFGSTFHSLRAKMWERADSLSLKVQ